MSKESIRSLLEAHGSFPDARDVRAGFDALFALARGEQESVEDLADGFMQALDQRAHVDAVVDPDVAQPVRDWALAHWTTSPYDLCLALCRLLANVPSPQVLAFLEAQRAQCANADVANALDDFISQMKDDEKDEEAT